MSRQRLLTASIATLVALFTTPFASATMYVVDSVNNLATMNLATGHVDIVGSTAAQFTDIAFDPAGRLYGITTRYLYEIDPANGWSTLIGDHGFGNPLEGNGLDALTFDSDGTLYAAGNNILVTIDPVTAAGATVGGMSGYRSAGDMTVDGYGRLVVSTDSGQLVNINRDGTGATLIGSLPHSDVYALATDTAGQVYGVRSTNELLTIDVDTGQSSVVTALDADFLFGYAWGGAIPPVHTPEPTTLLFWLGGGAALVRYARRAR